VCWHSCLSVERIHSRLGLLESQFRIGSNRSQLGSPAGSILGVDADDRSDGEMDEDDEEPQHSTSTSVFNAEGETFRDPVDGAARWHGPTSLYALCTRYRQRLAAKDNPVDGGRFTLSASASICEHAGRLDVLPTISDQSTSELLSHVQVTAAIDMFLANVDYSTDIFEPSTLRANVERVYSQSMRSDQDEAWLICLKTIFVLALGLQIHPRRGERHGGLFSSLARSILPSRVEMVSSRLLGPARLINVQALILLVGYA
jgi:hypothetical protein